MFPVLGPLHSALGKESEASLSHLQSFCDREAENPDVDIFSLNRGPSMKTSGCINDCLRARKGRQDAENQ